MARSRRNTVTRRLADGTLKTYVYDGSKRVAGPAEAKARTIGDLIRVYKAHPYFTKLAPSTQKAYRTALWKLEGIRDFQLATFSAEDVDEIHEAMAETPGMANMVMAVLKRMLKIARKKKWIATNPAADVERYETGEGEPWPGWAIDHFRSKAPAEWVFVIDLFLLSAQRRSDVIAFTLGGWDGRGMRFVQKKTGTHMYVELPQLADDLNRRKAAAKGGQVASLTFLKDGRGRPYTPDGFTAAFNKVVRDVGLGGKGLVVHGLRHTGLTWAAEGGATAHAVAALGGHQSLQDVRRYTKRADQKRLSSSAVAVLPTLAKRQNGGA
jgi:integrase